MWVVTERRYAISWVFSVTFCGTVFSSHMARASRRQTTKGRVVAVFIRSYLVNTVLDLLHDRFGGALLPPLSEYLI